MTYDEALDILEQLSRDIGGDGGGVLVKFMPEPGGTRHPFQLPITALTDIEIALVESTKAPAEERAAALVAVGAFLTTMKAGAEANTLSYRKENLIAMLAALSTLRGRL